MEYSKLTSLLRRVIMVPLLVTTALAGFLLWETLDLNRSMQWIDHTDQVLDQSGHLLQLLVDMESAKRGFIATGDESFLTSYIDGTKQFSSDIDALNQLVADSPSQQRTLQSIYVGYKEAEEYDNRIIVLRRAGKADPSLIDDVLRKNAMDKVRGLSRLFYAVPRAKSGRQPAAEPGAMDGYAGEYRRGCDCHR